MSIKDQLLTPLAITPVTVSMLGGEFNVTRLTAARLNQFDKQVKKFQASQDGNKLNIEAAQLVLDSVLDENNTPLSATTTADDLMVVHTPTAINAAMTRLLQLNFMSEGAEQEAKNA